MTVQSSTKDDLFNLDLIHSYVDKELNPRFVERHWLKQQIEDKLANPDCRFLLLTAEPGAGKSALMAWLAHQHPDWCRYFIRRDQRTPLGDVGIYSFLLQVGFQLAATYPHLFRQEQIKIVVEQRIGTATNSGIVGADIAKIFASPFYEKVIQIQQQVALSKDTNIIGVRVGEFYATERDLPLENLQFMALFDPAKAMMKQVQQAMGYPQRQLVVLVDALDELRYQDSDLSLLKWLRDCREIPENLRFVLTSRPDDGLLRAFRGSQQSRIQEISIAEEDPNVIQDLARYTHFLIETPEVNQALIEMHQDSDEFIHEAITKANGNFGYLGALARAVDEVIRQKHPDLLKAALDLSQLPNNLQDLYAFFLAKIKSAVDEQAIRVTDPQTGKKYFLEVWSEIYQPIIGILSVAREPLTLEQIQKFGDISGDWQHLVSAVDRLRQFLDKLENSYRLYHSTLPEFFTSPKTQTTYDYCYVDSVAQNRCIVSHYQAGAKSWAEVNFKAIVEDDYGRRHLAQHLVKADRVEELHMLLSLEKDGKNAWFDAKDRIGDRVGFVADVKLAWKQVGDKEFQQKPEIAIGLQCRYALITSSINSLSGNIPTSLVIKLMKIDSVKGLSYVQQLILNRHEQSLQVLNTLTLDFDEPKLRQKLLEMAQAISDKNYRTQVQSALAKYLSEEKLREVFEAAQVIQDEKDRASAISMLVPYLPSDQQIKILKATQAIKDEDYRAKVLGTLAQYLPKDLLPCLIKIICEIKSADYRTDALIGVLLYLPEKLLPEALKVILEIPRTDEEYSQTRALCGLAAVSNLTVDLLGKIQKAAEVFESKNYRIQVRSALAPHLSLDQLYKVLEEVQEIEDKYHRSRVLSALASRLPSDQLHKILEQAQAIQDEDSCSLVLSSLSHAPLNLQYKVLKEVQKIQDECNRFLVLRNLASAPNLNTELLEKIQKQAQAFQDKDYRIQVLSELASYLSEDQLYKVIEQAQEIPDKHHRSLTLSSFASHLPLDQLYKLLEEVQKIQDEYIGSMALSKLANAPNLTRELREKIQKQAEVFQNKDCRNKVLSSMAQYLSEELQLEVLETAREIQNEKDQAQILRALFPYLSSDQQAKILKTVLEFQDHQNQTQFLSILNLSSDQLHEILKEVQAIPDVYYRCLALSSLAAHLPPNQLYNLLEQVQAFQDEDNRTQVLSRLATTPNLTTDLREKIQKQAEVFQNKHNRIQILSLLAPYLQPKEKQKIFEEVQAIQDEYYRSLALSRLVPSLSSNQLQEALKATQEIQNEFNRGDILKVLAPELAKLPRDELYRLWSSTLHILANRNREHLLADIRELTPVIFSLGKHEAIVKICDAIWEIGQQWP